MDGKHLKRAAILLFHPDPEYFVTGAPIQISVYDTKLMIWNPGALPLNWTLETLLAKHASQPFNPNIANVFFRAGEIESWGRGIERIFESCAQAGIKKPIVKMESTGLWLTFEFTPVEILGDKLGDKLGDNRQKIIELMQKNPAISISQLKKEIGISSTAVENNIKYLKDNHFITRIGSTKSGHWVIIEDKK